MQPSNRIVLAYEGGVDASVAIAWLAERHRAEVVTLTLDMGQGGIEDVRDRALAAGAVRAHALDARDEFARDYLLPALQADAFGEDRRPMARALGRPLIARRLVELAGIEQAAAVAHGSTSEGDDHVRFSLEVCTLNPALTVLAPAQEWALAGISRADTIAYAKAHGIHVPARLDDAAPVWSSSRCPDEAAFVDLTFDAGVPTAINGVVMPLVELIGSIGVIAGAHGIGRVDTVENPLAGTPVLFAAHKALQEMVTAKDAQRFARLVSEQYTDIVYNGQWFSPLREALDAYVGRMQARVTGVIRQRLFKGDCRIVGRTSSFAASRTHDDASLVGTI